MIRTFETALFEWLKIIVSEAQSDSPIHNWQVCASDYEEPDQYRPGVVMIAAGSSQPRPQGDGSMREFNCSATLILLTAVVSKEESGNWAIARDKATNAGIEILRLLYQADKNTLGGYTCAAQAEDVLIRSFTNYKGEPYAVANVGIIANEIEFSRWRQQFVG